ncbi:MAG: methionyl-tRNA formyltransferase [Croceitalea sp.]|nr:methionyl-tRNA formyltransferase [Croceitalea sp.]NNC34691.1 methionyl-tRNA formyltransferase [Croceitalea sp.]NNL08897.1 methionyl-tRNA formyltransferase [Croceitalea sp.]NNM17489.1 methionyl-tRNA formyltransferase [Croceitalea sp.]
MNMASADSKNGLRIVYMGTPEFAVAGLQRLLEANYAVVGVVTAPDRPAGRGRKIQESAVKKYANKQGLPVLQPTNLKKSEFLAQLKTLNANLQIVVAFRMLPKLVWDMPLYGTFNLHASLLPQYRGAAPINWAIINGEKQTGVTTFFIDDKIDTGEIILQKKTSIGAEETAGELHDRLMVLGATLILKTVEQIEKGQIKATKQPSFDTLKSAPKIHRETCEIDWSKSILSIYNQIRGLSPYPTAFTTLVDDGVEFFLKIYRAKQEFENHTHKVGTLICDKKTMKVAVQNGYINLIEIQLPGKRKMKVTEALNGLSLTQEAYVR